MWIGFGIVLVALIIFMAFSLRGHMRMIDDRDRIISTLQSENRTRLIDLTAANAERDTARSLREHWRESAGEWRKEALAQLAYNRDLLMKLEKRTLPDGFGDEPSDPPSVAENDRRVAEERRAQRTAAAALEEGRVVRAVVDTDVEPEPEPEYAARDDDDDGN